MAKVVLFGTLDTAEIAHYYLEHDSPHQVAAFTVHAEYLRHDTFHGLPVVAFEEIERSYPPDDFRFFAPMTGRKMNTLREQVYLQAKAKGYSFISYVSSRASVFADAIGENCFILENNVIQPFARIGDNVVLWSGNHIAHHVLIKDHVFFTSHVLISGHCVVEPHCVFGGNSTIKEYLHVAEGTLLTMASYLTRDTEPWGIYKGNPAQRRRIRSIDFY
jgi:sugar O-acyltransferase (sialic acid O-acetyltransferase NeuD family)